MTDKYLKMDILVAQVILKQMPSSPYCMYRMSVF